MCVRQHMAMRHSEQKENNVRSATPAVTAFRDANDRRITLPKAVSTVARICRRSDKPPVMRPDRFPRKASQTQLENLGQPRQNCVERVGIEEEVRHPGKRHQYEQCVDAVPDGFPFLGHGAEYCRIGLARKFSLSLACAPTKSPAAQREAALSTRQDPCLGRASAEPDITKPPPAGEVSAATEAISSKPSTIGEPNRLNGRINLEALFIGCSSGRK